jgi:hypothetical protein
MFNDLNSKCFGFCNSWGYEIVAEYERHHLKFEFKFYKNTVTRNNTFIPEDSSIDEGMELIVSGLNKHHAIKIKESKIGRLFMIKELKEIVPSPYYFSTNVILLNEVPNWVSLFETYELHLLKLNNGKLVIESNEKEEDPLKLVEELEKMIKFFI